MSKLGNVVEAVEKYNKFVEDEVKRARADKKFGQQMVDRWNEIKAKIPVGSAPTGLKLPRLALPEIDEAGDITRYLLGDGLPGEFPFLNGAYREMYLEPLQNNAIEIGAYEKNGHNGKSNGAAAGVSPANRVTAKNAPARPTRPPSNRPKSRRVSSPA